MKTYKVTYREFNGIVITIQTYHNVSCECLFKSIIAMFAFSHAVSFQVVSNDMDETAAVLHFVYKDIKNLITSNIKSMANNL